MADFKECSIKAPHENHSWAEVDMTSAKFHYCKGKQWQNEEVFNDLQALIREALENPPGFACGELAPDAQIMQEIWPKVVGFLQPEDMPLKWEASEPSEWKLGPGPMMMLPPDPIERIADAVERIANRIDRPKYSANDSLDL